MLFPPLGDLPNPGMEPKSLALQVDSLPTEQPGKPTYMYIHTMEYYSAIKNNAILPFTTTWMGLEGIMLSEINRKRQTLLSPVCGI